MVFYVLQYIAWWVCPAIVEPLQKYLSEEKDDENV